MAQAAPPPPLSSSERKNILVVGLAHPPPAYFLQQYANSAKQPPPPPNIDADVQAARDAGYDLHVVQVSPLGDGSDIDTFASALRSRDWDGIIIGFGVRGVAEYTECFEKLVRLCGELRPGVRMGFNTRTDDLWEAVRRNFAL